MTEPEHWMCGKGHRVAFEHCECPLCQEAVLKRGNDVESLDDWSKKFYGRHYVEHALDGDSATCVLEGYTITGKPSQRYAFKQGTPDAARRLAVMAMNRGEIPC